MASGRIAVVGTKAMAFVIRGNSIVLERGFITQGSPDTFAETDAVGRLNDKVTYESTTGRVTNQVTRKTMVNGRPVALFFSGVTGPRIVRGWISGSVRTVLAG